MWLAMQPTSECDRLFSRLLALFEGAFREVPGESDVSGCRGVAQVENQGKV